MFTRVTETIFRDTFKAINPDQFTQYGLITLFAHLEKDEDNTGQEMAFNATDISCTFTEYANWAEFHDDYDSFLFSNGIESQNFEQLREHTTVIKVDEPIWAVKEKTENNPAYDYEKDGPFIISVF